MVEELTDDELDCVICCSRYNANTAYPMRGNCGHKACHKCIVELVSTQKTSEPGFSCPQCRLVQPLNLCYFLTKKLVVIEKETIAESRKDFSRNNLRCSTCNGKTALVDLRICLSCNPECVNILQTDDLSIENSSIFQQTLLCGKCERNHRFYHSMKVDEQPITLPLSFIFTKNHHHIVIAAIGLINSSCAPNEPFHPASIGMIILSRFLKGREIIEKDVAQSIFEDISNTTYFNELSLKNKGSSIFIEHYVKCLIFILEHYKEIKASNIVKIMNNVGRLCEVFKDRRHLYFYYCMWTTYMQQIFDRTYRCILRIYPTLDSDHIEIMNKYYEIISQFDGCPYHDLISYIYENEIEIYEHAEFEDDDYKRKIADYLNSIDTLQRTGLRLFLTTFFENREILQEQRRSQNSTNFV